MIYNRPDIVQQVDVLVIGLGPAGACGAQAAATRGCSVIAIDRKQHFGEPVQCAEFVPQALRPYGIEADCVVQSIQSMRSTLPSGQSHTVDSSGMMLQRAQFDRSLIAKAQQHGAQVMNASILRDLNIDQRIALVQTSAGAMQLQYKILIAADGARSQVARLANCPPLHTLRTQQYTVPLNKSLDTIEVRLSAHYPAGYAWVFPKGKLANVGVGFMTSSAAELKQALMRLLQSLEREGIAQNTIVSRTGGEIPVSGLREKVVRDHIVFAGDAAGLTHPITGAGIASAVISGKQAGVCAAEFVYGAGEKALIDYHESLHDVYAPVLSRAVQKRKQMQNTLIARADYSETIMRNCWTGFPEYFHSTGFA